MTRHPDVITPITTEALRRATYEYDALIGSGVHQLEGVNGFAREYLGDVPEGTSTLVTTNVPRSLAIVASDGAKRDILFLNIDLCAPDEDAAVIINPNHNSTDKKIVRPLTEAEGRELTMDLYSLMHRIPVHNE